MHPGRVRMVQQGLFPTLPTWIQWVAVVICFISADRSDTVLGLHFREERVELKKKKETKLALILLTFWN